MKYKFNEIHLDWLTIIKEEQKKSYFKELNTFLDSEVSNGKMIFPKESDIFSAFKFCSFADVKIVIIGQDPYHGKGQAHGLAFSVLPGVKIPPSLRNMYKELQDDIGMEIPNHGYLKSWATQGVLLLNNVLTVEESQANSHKNKGWEKFTDAIVDALNTKKEKIVFILWGAHAQKKGKNIDEEKHCVLKGHHPSPLSAYRGFFGCKHFSQANNYLREVHKDIINWNSINNESDGEYTQLSF